MRVGRQVTLGLASQNTESWLRGHTQEQGPSQVGKIRMTPGTLVN